jgi:hypothetical protein
MPLSAENVREVLHALDQLLCDRPEHERRREERMMVNAPAIVVLHQPGASDAEHSVVVKDIATRGVGLACIEPITVGTRFKLGFEAQQGRPIYLRCRVVCCERTDDGACRVGAAFDVSDAQGSELGRLMKHLREGMRY